MMGAADLSRTDDLWCRVDTDSGQSVVSQAPRPWRSVRPSDISFRCTSVGAGSLELRALAAAAAVADDDDDNDNSY